MTASLDNTAPNVVESETVTWQPAKQGGLRRTRVGTVGRAASAGVDQPFDQTVTRTLDTRKNTVVRFHPRVLGEIRLSWKEKLGVPGCEYLTRWGVETRFGSIRVHKWTGPDDDRAFHDHPWWFLTFVLRGGYTDVSPEGEERVSAPAIRFRPALHQHTVVPYPQGATTLLITGPKSRAWGFWLNGKFRKANKWFASFGHHPCNDLGDVVD